MWTAMTSPMVSTLPLHAPLSVLISTTSTTLHSSEAGLSATRGADTRQAFRHREAGMSELVVAARERRRGRVHRIAQFARRQIGDELAALPGECDRVLPAIAGEADNRRNAAKTIEKTVGREIDPPVERPGRNPTDRPRRDDRLERVVGQFGLVAFASLVEHRALTQERPSQSRREAGAAGRRSPPPCRYG